MLITVQIGNSLIGARATNLPIELAGVTLLLREDD